MVHLAKSYDEMFSGSEAEVEEEEMLPLPSKKKQTKPAAAAPTPKSKPPPKKKTSKIIDDECGVSGDDGEDDDEDGNDASDVDDNGNVAGLIASEDEVEEAGEEDEMPIPPSSPAFAKAARALEKKIAKKGGGGGRKKKEIIIPSSPEDASTDDEETVRAASSKLKSGSGSKAKASSSSAPKTSSKTAASTASKAGPKPSSLALAVIPEKKPVMQHTFHTIFASVYKNEKYPDFTYDHALVNAGKSSEIKQPPKNKRTESYDHQAVLNSIGKILQGLTGGERDELQTAYDITQKKMLAERVLLKSQVAAYEEKYKDQLDARKVQRKQAAERKTHAKALQQSGVVEVSTIDILSKVRTALSVQLDEMHDSILEVHNKRMREFKENFLETLTDIVVIRPSSDDYE